MAFFLFLGLTPLVIFSSVKGRRFLVAGYYGFGNAGDELILRSILGHLKKLQGENRIGVLSNNPKKTEAEHLVTAINRWLPWKVLKAILQCDILIFGGGGLLQDRTGSIGLWYYLSILWLALFFKRKIVVCAIGVGPLQSRFNKFLVARTLNCIDELAVRDQGSLLELQRFSVIKKAEVVSDPVLALPIFPRDGKISSKTHPRIGMVVRSLLQSENSDRLGSKRKRLFTERLSHSISKLAEKIDARISLIPFHPDKDSLVTKELLQKLNGKADLIQWNNLDELILFFSQMDFVVSMRLHGVILSALMAIPSVGIAVDPKIDHFLKEISPRFSRTHLVSLEQVENQELFSIALESWENHHKFFNEVSQRLAELKKTWQPFLLHSLK